MATTEVLESITANITIFEINSLTKLLALTILIAIYAIFIFYFYRFLAKKNLIELNLNKYNKYEKGTVFKLIAIILYVIEYVIILPIMTFFWFTVLAILIFLLSEELTLELVLLISAALIASVRVTSYISENLSQDLAKMLPFTLLGVALTKPIFFDITSHLSRIQEIPTLFGEILIYLIFIIIVELIMRVYDLIKNITMEAKALKDSTNDETEETSPIKP